jgi:hypothetical protein
MVIDMKLRGNVVTPPQVAWENITVAGMTHWLHVKHALLGNIENYVQYRQKSHLQYHILCSPAPFANTQEIYKVVQI